MKKSYVWEKVKLSTCANRSTDTKKSEKLKQNTQEKYHVSHIMCHVRKSNSQPGLTWCSFSLLPQPSLWLLAKAPAALGSQQLLDWWDRFETARVNNTQGGAGQWKETCCETFNIRRHPHYGMCLNTWNCLQQWHELGVCFLKSFYLGHWFSLGYEYTEHMW